METIWEMITAAISLVIGIIGVLIIISLINEHRKKQQENNQEVQPMPEQTIQQQTQQPVMQNPQPAQPPQPELTEAQRREMGLANWRAIAGDTFDVFNIFIKAGFTRSEALELTILFLSGKGR